MNTRTLSVALVGMSACLLSGVAQPATERMDWTPTAAQIAELEAHLPKSPPRGVGTAARYYYGKTTDGHRFIVGEILSLSEDKPPGIFIQRQLPLIMDGGCGVINLTYDMATRTFVGYACNGMA